MAQKNYREAHSELSHAAKLGEGVGRVRLQLDVHVALADLCDKQGLPDTAQIHRAKSCTITEVIEKSLHSSGLKAQLGIA